MNNTNKPIQTTLKYQKEFGSWLTAYRPYLNGGRSLAFEAILAFKSRINWNTSLQEIYVFILSPNVGKLN